MSSKFLITHFVFTMFRRLLHTTHKSLSSTKLHHHIPKPGLSFKEEYLVRSSFENLITKYSEYNIPQITLNSLIKLSTDQFQSNAISTINYLIILNSKRLSAFRSLPYLIVLNPHISTTYELYLKSLELLLKSTKDIEESDFDKKKLYDYLIKFQELHQDAIPSLSKGFQEVSNVLPHFTKKDIVKFLNKHFSDKINMETMTTNFIQSIEKPNDDHVGIINKNLKISELISIYSGFVNDMTFIKYYKTVPIEIDHGKDIIFPYIGHHLEYIFTEILKNSIRAHIENNKSDSPIKITIVETKNKENKKVLGIRFRDEGGGIPSEIEHHIFDYSFTTVEKEQSSDLPGEDANVVAGMGYGLPLTKAYVEQFGGKLELQSCYGLGTDVYVELIGPDDSLL